MNYGFIYGTESLEVGLVVGGRLDRFREISTTGIVDDIYVARVTRRLDALNGYEVDLGKTKAFLSRRDSLGEKKPGTPALFQVAREGVDGKLPRVTERIALFGKTMVLRPTEERKPASKFRKDKRPLAEEMNAIVEVGAWTSRRNAEGASEEQLRRDYEILSREWERLEREKEFLPIPRLLKKGNVALSRAFSVIAVAEEIYVQDKGVYRQLKEVIDVESQDRLVFRPSFRPDEDPAVSAGLLERESREVALKSGGNIVVEELEAVTFFDVNSGSDRRGRTKADNALAVNEEAAEEIARQIRLRNIGGMVVVDYITMRGERDESHIRKIFAEALETDGRKISVYGFTKMKLFELSIQRR